MTTSFEPERPLLLASIGPRVGVVAGRAYVQGAGAVGADGRRSGLARLGEEGGGEWGASGAAEAGLDEVRWSLLVLRGRVALSDGTRRCCGRVEDQLHVGVFAEQMRWDAGCGGSSLLATVWFW